MDQELNRTYSETLRALVSALDTRDSETGGHSERVTLIALSIAHQMRLDDKIIQQIHWGALLHDVGKIGVPDQILRKQGPLTDEEWKIMRTHPVIGFEMLKDIPFLHPVLDVVLYHHERFDGSGYPSGLIGENIPLSARIFSVADSYDAMTNDRPYRKAFSGEEAVAEIQRCVNRQFDPDVVEAFIIAFEKGWESNPHTHEKRTTRVSILFKTSKGIMNHKISHSKLKFQKNTSVRIKDIIIAIGWAFIFGIPLFIVHMIFFDFEHAQQMGDNYSIIQSLTETIPHHPISLALWLLAIFIAAFAIRHAFQQQSLLIREQEKLALSHRQALTDGLTGIWNRSGYEQLFKMAIERSRDQNRLFSIILGDVDGLKEL